VVRRDGELALRTDELNTYLEAELKTPKLDKIYNRKRALAPLRTLDCVWQGEPQGAATL
jgi:hypothetical protein